MTTLNNPRRGLSHLVITTASADEKRNESASFAFCHCLVSPPLPSSLFVFLFLEEMSNIKVEPGHLLFTWGEFFKFEKYSYFKI